MAEAQERRDRKQVPGGLRLHQYANLYFHARNPMLYARLTQASTLCVYGYRATCWPSPEWY